MTQQEPGNLTEIRSQFERSNLCRVIYADGVWGSVTPHLNIYMAVYNEHWMLPHEVVYAVDQGSLNEKPQVPPEALTRQLEVEILFSIDTARSVGEWLLQRAKDAAEIQAGIKPTTVS